jgi:hypothetical protein
MRFFSIYQSEGHELSPDQMAAMGKLVDDMNKAGVMLATGGCAKDDPCFRVRRENGKTLVTDGPFLESKELVGGYCLMQVKSKEEAIEWNKRFMAIMGRGVCETHLLMDTPGE